MSCIKSIQRGADSGNKTITISEVDMSKSIILVSGGGVIGSYGDYPQDINGAVPIGNLTSNTSIEIANAVAEYRYDDYGNITKTTISLSYIWQVIEFA